MASALAAAAKPPTQVSLANPRQHAPSNQLLSKQEWASLNPYGSDINSYPPEERTKIAELQRQWELFLPYLVSSFLST